MQHKDKSDNKNKINSRLIKLLNEKQKKKKKNCKSKQKISICFEFKAKQIFNHIIHQNIKS
jgi:hypothetical protein